MDTVIDSALESNTKEHQSRIVEENLRIKKKRALESEAEN